MKISIAKTAGFCMGVHRAVEMALDAANDGSGPIYTFGPLIHNPQVLKLLREKGIRVLDEIPESGEGTVLIRAHGVPPDKRKQLEAAGFSIIDATCPRVIKVQAIIEKHAREGCACIIVGDRDHPEVVGLLGYAGKKAHVVGRMHELDSLPNFDKAIVVAQTTQNTLLFDAVKKWAENHHPRYKVFNTICDSTERRQAEARRLADAVDAVVVVGGHESGNTQRLVEIVQQNGKPAYHIETEAELSMEVLKNIGHVGITAGASTPNWIIKRIYRFIESLPYRDDPSSLKRRIFSLQRFLLITNIYLALGAGALCYACTQLQALRHMVPYIVISVFYILSMHMLNHLTGIKEARFNDPDRAVFYETNKILLTLMALISGALGLSIAAGLGMFPFVLLFIMSVLGLAYNMPLIPGFIRNVKHRRIRDIPGSKTILIALAWAMVTTLFPVLAETGTIRFSTLPVVIWAGVIVFVRAAFFDVLDMQGDRIVGKETIPILMGRDKALALLRAMLLIVFVILFLSSVFRVISGLGYVLLASPLKLFVVLVIHKRGYMMPGIRMEFLMESHLLLIGFVTLLWNFWH